MKFGKLSHVRLDGQKVFLDFEGQEARLEVVTPRIINVFCGLETEEHRSRAIEGSKELPAKVKIEEKEGCVWVYTEDVRVRVSDGFYVDFYDRDGEEVCSDYRGERKQLQRLSDEAIRLMESEGHEAGRREDLEPAVEVVKKLTGTEHFYGLGDKTGFLDKRHYEYEMWNTDNPDPQVDTFKALYKSIPFFITLTDSHVYGIFVDNSYKGLFNMGQESEDYYFFHSDHGNLDYYYLAGNSIPEVLGEYMYLTGTHPLPQKWTLGYHQSRWGYMTQEDIEEVADGLRNNDIPCDVLHFDIDYMDHYKVFTWNTDRYHGDPKSFLKKLSDRGFKPVTIIDPGVKKEKGYSMYDEGMANGYFATLDGQVYENVVWPGESVYPDFGNPQVRKWWASKQKFLVDLGVRGVWNDMNEPASFHGSLPDDVIFTEEDRAIYHAKMHNVYGHLMAKATYEGLKESDGRRPFVITRACYAGTQKYSTAWTGDNTSIWAHLQMAIPQLCNLGLSGMPYVGTDIGGFGADTTPELMARWIQVGCFSPLFRNHTSLGSRRQEPWLLGDEVLRIYRKYVKLRYEWLPYFYDLFFEEEKTGMSILRPLVFHYEKDKAARVCNDEFLVGSQVLVAPVVNQGMDRRMVYLPEGIWYDYWTGEKLTGSVWFVREAPLDTCPIYVKAGSVIPTMEPMSYVGERPLERLILKVYPGEGSYDHYLDNGEDFAYREGAYHHYRFTVKEDGSVETRILHGGYEKPYREISVELQG